MSKNSSKRKRQQQRKKRQQQQAKRNTSAVEPARRGAKKSPQATDVAPQGQGELFAVEEYTETFHAGPLPSPQTLLEYDNVVPGSAERIISMAERQAQHRQKLEKTVVTGGSLRSNAGLVFGFILSLSFLAASVYLVTQGYAWPGTALGTIDIVGLATVFVIGKREQRIERQDKARRN